MTGTEQKYYALLIMRFNDVVKDRGGVPVLLSCFGRSWGIMCGVSCPCMGFNSSCAFYGLVCLVYGLFIGSLTTLYRITLPALFGPLCGLFMPCFAMVLWGRLCSSGVPAACPVIRRLEWLCCCLYGFVRRFLSVSVFGYRGGANCLVKAFKGLSSGPYLFRAYAVNL